MIKSQVLKFFLLIHFLLFSGCAFVDQEVRLTYNPVGITSGGKGPISISRPENQTLGKNSKGLFVIGTVRNGYGMRTADTVTPDSPADWVVLALKTELSRAGFEVQLVEAVSANATPTILPAIDKIWVDHDMGFFTVGAAAEVGFRLAIYQNGRKVDVLSFRDLAEKRATFGGDAEQKGEALQAAMQACMAKAVPEIIQKTEPSL